MTMARFKPNQEIVCVVPRSGWHKTILSWIERIGIKNKFHGYGPDTNEIVTVECYSDGVNVLLKEYPKTFPPHNGRYGYNEACFEALADISELTEILEHQTQDL